MAAILTISLDSLEKVKAAVDSFKLSGSEKKELLSLVGIVMADQTRQRFKSRVDAGGKVWAPWSRAYKLTRANGKSLLRSEGHLESSITHEVSGNILEVGSEVEYGATHQYGDNQLINRKTKNGKRSKAFNRNIPQRAFLGINSENKDEIEAEIIEYLEEIITAKMAI